MADTPTVVLLVEDDKDDYVLTKAYLEAGGRAAGLSFELRWSETLEQALTALEKEHPAVVLVDLNLPDSSGWDTFAMIYAQAPTVAVIILTGLTDEKLGMKAVQRGAQDYLTKGEVDGSQLVRAIRYAVERKGSETALKRYQDHLEELIRQRTGRIRQTNQELRQENKERRKIEAELREALTQLEEHNKAKSRFVGNVSHELKTPLTSMAYAIDNLMRGIVAPVPEAFASYLEMLNDDCQRLIRTVNDILDLSRIEANTLRLNRSKIAFRHFVERSAASMTMLAAHKAITLEVDLSGAAGFVECDAYKMERVVLNVIQNALKFTPSGGDVRVGTRTVEEDGSEFMVLDVRDTGMGIPKEHLAHVTERYFHIGEHVSGSGLGLAIAKELLEMHGGRIELASPPPDGGEGTLVSLFMPRVSPPLILFAVGQSDRVTHLRGYLADEGYEVRASNSGQEALGLFQEKTPDAVLMDFYLDGMDGVELLAKIKADYNWLHVPLLIVLTGDVDTMKRELIEGFRLPAVAPDVSKERLLHIVSQAMVEQPNVT